METRAGKRSGGAGLAQPFHGIVVGVHHMRLESALKQMSAHKKAEREGVSPEWREDKRALGRSSSVFPPEIPSENRLIFVAFRPGPVSSSAC
jgi:hypothetical protein